MVAQSKSIINNFIHHNIKHKPIRIMRIELQYDNINIIQLMFRNVFYYFTMR